MEQNGIWVHSLGSWSLAQRSVERGLLRMVEEWPAVSRSTSTSSRSASPQPRSSGQLPNHWLRDAPLASKLRLGRLSHVRIFRV